MKTTLFYTLIGVVIYSLVVTILLFIAQSNNDCIKFKNSYLKEMNNIIINYADSTADTGEMNDFIQSKAGQDYFELNEELYGKK